MSQVRPFEAIPFVELPPDYQMRLGPLLAEVYAKHGPIFRSTYFGQEIVYLVGPEANRFVLVQDRLKFSNYIGWSAIFSVVDMFGRGLLSMDGQEHARHRKMMNPAFTVSYMDRYLPLMNRIIQQRAATWLEAGEVDIYVEARKITFDIAASALTGLEVGPEVDRFRELFIRILMIPGQATSDDDFYQQLRQVHGELHALLLPKIEERRQRPTDDIFGMLVQARDEQGQAVLPRIPPERTHDHRAYAHGQAVLPAPHPHDARQPVFAEARQCPGGGDGAGRQTRDGVEVLL